MTDNPAMTMESDYEIRYRQNQEDCVANHIDDSIAKPSDQTSGEGVAMKKSINLVTAISVIVGSIIGSGIFISPKGVLEYSGSVGTALIVWALCGLAAFLGGLCYAELGCAITKSGGEYTYLNVAFGPFLAFLMLWINFLIVAPGNVAIISQTFAIYVIVPFYGDCLPPDWAVILISEACIILIYFYNCATVVGAAWVQVVCTIAKVLGLLIIIIAGIVLLIQGNTEYLTFDGPGTSVSRISLAFYNGLFAYAGWSCLNAITEEMTNPRRDFPISLSGSMITITVIYVLTNIAYFAAMSPQEMLASPAVAVTFGDKVLGNWAWLMPVAVALSTFGAANGQALALSRLTFVGARDGFFPDFLGMVHVKFLTPLPALLTMGILTALYGLYPDVGTLINYTSFTYWLFVALVTTGLIVMRWTQKDLERPFKCPLWIAIIFAIFCYFIVIVSIFAATIEAVIGTIIILTGIPVYFYAVKWTPKPPRLAKALDACLHFCQKLTLVVMQEKDTF
ncbi:Y+L amino acid transporter 2-like isoform X2 [Ptychodera flava]|uniref:Y+L amino acid transporter 2-like isoform X2 n=1 Tax=Ptychodera flava TaxID=63121 RepID=UPI003969D20D